MKLALILNTIDPSIGGVLIRGEKGTGKSTAVRALASLLPRLRLTDLPLNATEDMLLGSIDFEYAMKEGKRRLQPGILARADGGILYIDEVNLLDDHLIDVILDTAASGINVVEREGISRTHSSRFILVGTMNPEEGSLRAQFLDRFGLCVDVEGNIDPEIRVQLMEIREAFDTDPEGLTARYAARDREIAEEILKAKKLLPSVGISREVERFICELCIENRTAGHRADIIIQRSACAYAALQGRGETTIRDVQYVARFALLHRSRIPQSHHEEREEECSHPFEKKKAEIRQEEREVIKTGELKASEEETRRFPSMKKSDPSETPEEDTIKIEREQVFEIGATFRVKPINGLKHRTLKRGLGKRNRSTATQRKGRYIKSRPAKYFRDIAFDATIRTAAPYQKIREKAEGLSLVIRRHDIQEKIREKKIGNFFLFIVDASGSMAARQRMIVTKGAIFSLLIDAYQKRDKAAMVTFQKKSSKLLLPPTSSIELAGKLLKELPVGGRTPLSRGLLQGYTVLKNYLLKEPDASPVTIIITDGKANIGIGKGDPFRESLRIAEMMSHQEGIKYIVVDTLEPRQANLGTAKELARYLQADYFKIEDLKTTDLVQIARSETT